MELTVDPIASERNQGVCSFKTWIRKYGNKDKWYSTLLLAKHSVLQSPLILTITLAASSSFYKGGT